MIRALVSYKGQNCVVGFYSDGLNAFNDCADFIRTRGWTGCKSIFEKVDEEETLRF
jgi:hypothetical protein